MVRIRHIIHLFITLFPLVVLFAKTGNASQAPRKVLVLNAYHQGFHWTDRIMTGVHQVFDEQENIDVHIEYMDTKRYSDSVYFKQLYTLYEYKYANVQFDVILSSDDHALNFLLLFRNALFPDVPVVFCGINDFSTDRIKGHHQITGVYESYDVYGTIQLIRALHPGIKELAVVCDSTASGRAFLARIDRVIPLIKDSLKVVFCNNLNRVELLDSLAYFGDHTAVLWGIYTREPNGQVLTIAESIELLVAHIPQPVYCIWDVVGFGVVGGKITDPEFQGARAAQHALQIIEGQEPDAIPITGSPMRYKFDHVILKKHRINQKLLPKRSLIINQEDALYFTYRRQILGVGAFILLSILVIVLLLYLYRRKNRAEKAMRNREKDYRQLLQYSPVGLAKLRLRKPLSVNMSHNQQIDWLYKNTFVSECNEIYAEIFGYQSSRDIRNQIPGLFWTEGEDKSKWLIGKFIENAYGFTNYEMERVRKNGETLHILTNVFTTIEDEMIHSGWAMVVDITELKTIQLELNQSKEKLEQLVESRTSELKESNEELSSTVDNLKTAQLQLVQSERMASLGVMMSGISYELNNPLNYIQGSFMALAQEMTSGRPGNETEIKELLDNIKEGVDQASKIIKGLNLFSKSSDTMEDPCYLHDIMDNCLVMLNHQMMGRIQIQKNYCSEEIIILGNTGKMHQLFMGLITNAFQAIAGEGTIRINTSQTNDAVRVEVADTGIGIPKDQLDKVYDPFFTTRLPGEGTGLGLTICKGIVTEQKGTIALHSEPGKGTQVLLSLPSGM